MHAQCPNPRYWARCATLTDIVGQDRRRMTTLATHQVGRGNELSLTRFATAKLLIGLPLLNMILVGQSRKHKACFVGGDHWRDPSLI
ncbi:hypothetical protein BN77_p10374 [Rhizobium mesoamericanum STM3625]|uniref:Uncharacterized protein n=1 Tax=Rhizobium mesoamericanum STM3625 TaxID=1211777 RepID=K0Q627_9HYPH|nr:hypothetical protein BN77_p10374 [Rhizobium mesoamericanum STM3625]